MPIAKKTGKTTLPSKKEVRKSITRQLVVALTDLRKLIGDEKFNLRVKKAVKVLTRDLEKEPVNIEETSIDQTPEAEKLPTPAKKTTVQEKKPPLKKAGSKKTTKTVPKSSSSKVL